MSTDIYFNGTQYPDRTGNNKFGTFYNQIVPPLSSGSTFIPTGTLNLNFEDVSGVGDPKIQPWTTSFNLGVMPYFAELTTVQNGTRAVKIELNHVNSNPAYLMADFIGLKESWTGSRIATVSFWLYGTAGWKTPFRGITSGDTTLMDGTYTATNTNTWEQAIYATNVLGTNFRAVRVYAGTNAVSGAGSIAYIDNFSLTVSPQAVGGVQTMDTNWGGRVAENTGRVRGYSMIGTVPKDGTLTVTFPANFFTSFRPMIDVRVLRNDIQTKFDKTGRIAGKFFTDSWFSTLFLFTGGGLGVEGIVEEPRPVPLISEIGTVSCKVTAYWSPEKKQDCVVSVHAWGV